MAEVFLLCESCGADGVEYVYPKEEVTGAKEEGTRSRGSEE